MCVCVRACVRACVCVCVRVCSERAYNLVMSLVKLVHCRWTKKAKTGHLGGLRLDAIRISMNLFVYCLLVNIISRQLVPIVEKLYCKANSCYCIIFLYGLT